MTNVLQFNAAIEQWQLRTSETINRVLQRAAIAIVTSVVDKTPRDTGFAASQWYTFVTGPSSAPGGSIGAPAVEGDPVAQALSVIANLKIGGRMFCVNSVPYIIRLEYGWSQQASGGMVRITATALPQIVAQAIAEERAA